MKSSMKWGSLVRRLLDDPYDTPSGGWASNTFESSVRGAVLRSVAAWQVVMVLTVLAQPGVSLSHLLLAVSHLTLIGLALAAVTHRALGVPVVVAGYATFVGAWAVTASVESPLLLAACWQVNLAAAIPAAVLRGRQAIVVVVVSVIVVPIIMVLVRPDVDSILPVSVFVTGLSILAATRVGFSFAIDFVRGADAEWAAAARQREEFEAHRRASWQAAEDARVLHDTAINTLAALAAGGGSVGDPETVRRRCAEDVATMTALARPEDGRPLGGATIRESTENLRIRVHHTGIGDDDLRHREALLEPEVQAALARATGELVRNAAKHARVDDVVVDIGADQHALYVTVSDEGVGFDGALVPGRGLAESVVARLAEVGARAEVRSAPGRGTWVRLTCPVGVSARQPAQEPVAAGFARFVRHLQSTASGLFAIGLVVVGAVLSVTNHHGKFNAEMPMVLVVAAVCGLAWPLRERRGRSSLVVVVVLAAGAAAAFVLSAAAVDYGRTGVVRWQAICPVGPLLLMLGVRAWRRCVPWAAAAYGATVLAVAGSIGMDHPRAALSVMVAGAAGLGLLWGWAAFQRTVAQLGRQAVSAAREAAAFRLEVTALDAAARARRRWSSAVLETSMDLLRTVADGRADPSAPEVRRACGEEERYLRQLTQLSPGLIQMGEWFAHALAGARNGSTELTVRSGDIDVDAVSADAVGDLLIRGLAGVSAGKVTTTLFPTAQDLRFTLVGPGPDLSTAVRGWVAPEGTVTSVHNFGSQDLVEVVWPPDGSR